MMLSRVSGLGRDLVMAYSFGDHPSVAAFIVAFRFANVLRRFFGEGPLQSAFIPQFEGLERLAGEAFFRKLCVVVGLVVLCAIGLGELLLGKGEIARLTGWMLPALFFVALYGLNISLLQCRNKFFVSSMAPVLCNTCWMIGAWMVRNWEMERAMVGLAQWVLGGFVLQWLVTAVQLRLEIGRGRWLGGGLFDGEMWRLGRTFSLGAIGVGAAQINSFLDAVFARFAHVSGPVYLWYASKFQQLALALFGIAAVNTLVPVLSRAIKGGDREEGERIFRFGCRRVLAVMVPMTVAIGVLGYGAIDCIFGRGSFSEHAVGQTAACLGVYGLGIVPATLILLYSTVFYAEGNFKTPMLFSVGAVALNIGLNGLFVFGMGLGPIAIALSTSLGIWMNFLGLRWALKGWKTGVAVREMVLLIGGSLGAGMLVYGVGPKLVGLGKMGLFLTLGAVFVGCVALFIKQMIGSTKAQVATSILE